MHAAQRAPLHAKWMANASHLLHFVQSDGIAKREPTYCEHHTATTGGYDGTNYYLTLSDRTHCCWYIYRSDVCFCTAARLLHFTFEICVKHRHKHTHSDTHWDTRWRRSIRRLINYLFDKLTIRERTRLSTRMLHIHISTYILNYFQFQGQIPYWFIHSFNERSTAYNGRRACSHVKQNSREK